MHTRVRYRSFLYCYAWKHITSVTLKRFKILTISLRYVVIWRIAITVIAVDYHTRRCRCELLSNITMCYLSGLCFEADEWVEFWIAFSVLFAYVHNIFTAEISGFCSRLRNCCISAQMPFVANNILTFFQMSRQSRCVVHMWFNLIMRLHIILGLFFPVVRVWS